MRIDAALLVRSGEIRDAVADLVGVGIDTWSKAHFPSEIHIPVFVRIVGAYLEEPRDLVIRFLTDGGDVLVEVRRPIQVAVRPVTMPESAEVSTMAMVSVRVEVPDVGNYMLEMYVDDEHVDPKRLPVFVRHN